VSDIFMGVLCTQFERTLFAKRKFRAAYGWKTLDRLSMIGKLKDCQLFWDQT